MRRKLRRKAARVVGLLLLGLLAAGVLAITTMLVRLYVFSLVGFPSGPWTD